MTKSIKLRAKANKGVLTNAKCPDESPDGNRSA